MSSRNMQARLRLESLLEKHELTAGMTVRTHGAHLIMGRCEPPGPGEAPEFVPRVRLTHLSGPTYGLSVRRHTGRWERTPFTGSMEDMVEVMLQFMQHLIAPLG